MIPLEILNLLFVQCARIIYFLKKSFMFFSGVVFTRLKVAKPIQGESSILSITFPRNLGNYLI